MTKEEIYDTQIEPALNRALDIAEANGVPFFAVFGTEDGQMVVSVFHPEVLSHPIVLLHEVAHMVAIGKITAAQFPKVLREALAQHEAAQT